MYLVCVCVCICVCVMILIVAVPQTEIFLKLFIRTKMSMYRRST